MKTMILQLTLMASMLLALVRAECPNACSSHGKCGAYDACICYRNWGSNDCSERICQFGTAHVDTPLGDLDASGGALTGGATGTLDSAFKDAYLVVEGSDMYPHGTYEQYPRMEDSDNTVKDNTAHAYRECSNKGLCDRSSGTCDCFPGYEGSACQRASCPASSNGVCSGHGTCKTIQELALQDHGNVYRMWDEDMTMGCDCDAGYNGADCSQRVCKYGTDPLYHDDFQNTRFANFTLQFYMTSAAEEAHGNYSLVFTDRHGEDWQTDPIDINAPCSVLQDRLESLPNNVIPTGSVLCSRSHEDQHTTVGDGKDGQATPTTDQADTNYDGAVLAQNGIIYDKEMLIIARYILAFPGNPGEIAPLKVNKYLDGNRPTLFTSEDSTGGNTLGWAVFPNGYIGEDTDYVNDECEGVLVNFVATTPTSVQSILETENDQQDSLLKKCLGDSNGDATDNTDVYDWDWGTWTNPHLIKLVDATQDAYVEYIRADGSAYKVLTTGDEYYVNDAEADYPVTTLCNNGKNYLHSKDGITFNWYYTAAYPALTTSAASDTYLGEWGWCKNLNPPGVYAVIYFDSCGDQGVTKLTGGVVDGTSTCHETDSWRVINNVGLGHADTTKFHVYTTKGTMQQVSQYAEIHTTRDTMSMNDRINAYHSNEVFMNNITSRGAENSLAATYGGAGEMDCETLTTLGVGASGQGTLDCLAYGDKVMFLNLGTHDEDNCMAKENANMAGVSYSASDKLSCQYVPTEVSFASNPSNPNMYTIKKIGYEPQNLAGDSLQNELYLEDQDTGSSEKSFDSYRRRIVLDHGMNANYQMSQGFALNNAHGSQSVTDANDDDYISTGATVYKFYPPTLATTGTTGYNYVGECSNRGICDSETGQCGCFAGYSGDDCSTVTSLN